MTAPHGVGHRRWAGAWRWLTADAAGRGGIDPARGEGIDWLRALPRVAVHLACLGAFAVGVSGVAPAIGTGH